MPSKDPVQQKLRLRKKKWNNAYRGFSQKLKAFKDGLNGHGNAKFNMPESKIQFPLPDIVGGTLDTLMAEFNQLATEATGIIDEQGQYSSTRKQKRPKSVVPRPALQQEAPANPNVVETLSRLGNFSPEIEKEASNRISRFWQYFTSMFSRKEYNKQRISLLTHSADLYWALYEFQSEVLSRSQDSLRKSIGHFVNVSKMFETLEQSVLHLKQLVESKSKEQVSQTTEETSGQVPSTSPPPESKQKGSIKNLPGESKSSVSPVMASMERNLHMLWNADLAKNECMQLSKLIEQFKKETDEQAKVMLKDVIKDEYKKLINSIKQEVQKKYGPTTDQSVEGIIKLIQKNKNASVEAVLTKRSTNKLTRFLKKRLMKMMPFDKMAIHKLEISDLIDETNSIINKMMDSLEKGIDYVALTEYLKEINKNMQQMQKPMSILGSFFQQEFYDIRSKDKDDDLSFLLRRKIRRDLGRGVY